LSWGFVGWVVGVCGLGVQLGGEAFSESRCCLDSSGERTETNIGDYSRHSIRSSPKNASRNGPARGLRQGGAGSLHGFSHSISGIASIGVAVAVPCFNQLNA
jgi:hypothetical protein